MDVGALKIKSKKNLFRDLKSQEEPEPDNSKELWSLRNQQIEVDKRITTLPNRAEVVPSKYLKHFFGL